MQKRLIQLEKTIKKLTKRGGKIASIEADKTPEKKSKGRCYNCMRLGYFVRDCTQRGRGGRGRYKGRGGGSYRGRGGYDQGNYGNEFNRENNHGRGNGFNREQAYGYNSYSSDPGSG